jgi:uncharacterized protein
VIIVSDTSPVRALQALDLVHLLREFYGTVLIPPGVARELAAQASVIGSFDLGRFPFLRVQAPLKLLPAGALPEKLGPGESEAIALALELRADVLLIDEIAGRSAAQRLGLATTGVLRMLVRAKSEGRIESVASMLDRLSGMIQFRTSQALRERVLRDAGEL